MFNLRPTDSLTLRNSRRHLRNFQFRLIRRTANVPICERLCARIHSLSATLVHCDLQWNGGLQTTKPNVYNDEKGSRHNGLSRVCIGGVFRQHDDNVCFSRDCV